MTLHRLTHLPAARIFLYGFAMLMIFIFLDLSIFVRANANTSLLIKEYEHSLLSTEYEITLKVKLLSFTEGEMFSPLDGAKITVTPSNKNIEYRETKTTDGKGEVLFKLPKKTNYNILAEAIGYSSQLSVIDLTNLEGNVTFLIMPLQKSNEMGWSADKGETLKTNFYGEYLIFILIVMALIEIVIIIWLVLRMKKL